MVISVNAEKLLPDVEIAPGIMMPAISLGHPDDNGTMFNSTLDWLSLGGRSRSSTPTASQRTYCYFDKGTPHVTSLCSLTGALTQPWIIITKKTLVLRLKPRPRRIPGPFFRHMFGPRTSGPRYFCV